MQRYEPFEKGDGMWACADGEFVRHEEAQAEIDALQAEIARLNTRLFALKDVEMDLKAAQGAIARLTAPVTDEDVFAFSLDTLDPQESIPVFIRARAAGKDGPK